MAGIYIHVPFCKSRCIYCGFFSTTQLALRDDYTRAVCRELELRKNYLHSQPIETIYLGGGTPSQLSLQHIEKILGTIYNIYNVRAKEITVECNPDDAGKIVKGLHTLGVNRLSIGIQTFNDERLNFLHRRHTATQAMDAIHLAQSAGFENISIDLMFGFPRQTLDEWKQDVNKALSLNIQHLSAYSLMYEEGTPLEQMLSQGDIVELDDESARAMYEYLLDATIQAGYVQYEISNFSLPGKQSLHNSCYWHGIPYLGIGAGAHSFDGETRQFNIHSLPSYIEGARHGIIPFEKESLNDAEKYNEFVFTALRTREGMSTTELTNRFGETFYDYCLSNAKKHIDHGVLILEDGKLRLSRNGLFISNDIMSDLMWTN
ncbi:MAG: radical SAM family heme chaperone HemW [Bacteroidaceae bacterium]|nr:radical SAM family heme chaperone HemW [Bacteroidaceae bacterium]